MNSSPAIVSGSAQPPAKGPPDERLTDEIAGQDPGRQFERWTDRPTCVKGVALLGRREFPCKFSCSCNENVLHCSLYLAAVPLTFVAVVTDNEQNIIQ